MGYRNLDTFYDTSRTIAVRLGLDKKDFNKKFEKVLSTLGFEDSHMAWYRGYGNKHPMIYIFSGDNVSEKIGRLFKIADDGCPLCQENEITELLISIIPDEKYRTVASRYETVPSKTFNPETDPRAEGIRWMVSNHFHHMI